MLSCPALTNDYETDEHCARTSSLKSTTTSDEETCADSATTKNKSAFGTSFNVKRGERPIKDTISKFDGQKRWRRRGIMRLRRLTWRSSAYVSLSDSGAARLDQLRPWLHRGRRG